MVHRPLPGPVPCPNCGARPVVKFGFFIGARAECACGLCGPWTNDGDWPEHAALDAWARAFGLALKPRTDAAAAAD